MLSLAVLYVICFELEGVVVFGFVPHHHGVVIGPTGHVLVGPFRLLGLVDCKGTRFLLIQLQGVLKVGEFIPVVVVSTLLLHTEVLCLRESDDICLIGLFVHELVGIIVELVGLEVEYCDSVLSRLEEDGFTVA
jgi:hypothetical protein